MQDEGTGIQPAALSTPATAVYCDIPEATLNTWRSRGGGPPFLKIGRRVLYLREDLDEWLRDHRREPPSDEVA